MVDLSLNIDLLREERARLVTAFDAFSHRDGLFLGTSEFDEQTLDLITRLFYRYSMKTNRAIAIDLNESSTFNRDAFFKRAGIEYDVRWLNITVSPGESDLETLWRFYVDWLLREVDEEEIEATLAVFLS